MTHLPQVACQGHQHLRVAKISDGRSTRISVTALSGEARVEEIARMLGGVEITAARPRPRASRCWQRAASAVAPAAPLPATAAPPEPAATRRLVAPSALRASLRRGQSGRWQRPYSTSECSLIVKPSRVGDRVLARLDFGIDELFHRGRSPCRRYDRDAHPG